MKLPDTEVFKQFVDEEIEECISQTEDAVCEYQQTLKTLNEQTNCSHEPTFDRDSNLCCKHCEYVVIDIGQFRTVEENEFIKFMQSR